MQFGTSTFGGGMGGPGGGLGIGGMNMGGGTAGVGGFGVGFAPLPSGPGLPPLGGPTTTLLSPISGPAQININQLRLKPQEIQFYNQLFAECDVNHSGSLSGIAVKGLFNRSKLSKAVLAGIWTLADRQKKKSLDKDDFAVALRLIALAQNGYPVSEQSLRQYTDIQLPAIEGAIPGQPSMNIPAGMTSPAGTPSASSIPIGSPLGAGTATTTTGPPPLHSVQSLPVPSPASHKGLLFSDSVASHAPTHIDWSMTADERAQYSSLFSQADEDQDGYVGGKEANKFFSQSELDKKTLRQVWLLADIDKDNKLNHEEFSIAMHLVLKLRQKYPLPTTLPEVLQRKSGGAHTLNGPIDGGITSSSSSSSAGSHLLSSPISSLDFGLSTSKKGTTTNQLDDFGSFSSLSTTPSTSSNQSLISATVDDGFGTSKISSSIPATTTVTNNTINEAAGNSGGFSAPPIGTTSFFPDGSASAFLNGPGDESEKQRQLGRVMSTAQSAIHYAQDQLKGLENTLSIYTQKTRILVEQVAKAGAEYDLVQRSIAEEQTRIETKKEELAKLEADHQGIINQIEASRQSLIAKQQELQDTKQKIIDAHTSVPQIKKETTEIDMQIAITESQLTSVRQTWKQYEDQKNVQLSILQARKDQAGKLLREKAEVQEMLDAAQLELQKIKNEANIVKENTPRLHSSIADMRSNLKELQELVTEERKNPTQTTHVRVNQNGQLELGTIAATSRNITPAATVAATKPATSIQPTKTAAQSMFDDDDDFSVPDVDLPGMNQTPSASLSIPSAAPSKLSLSSQPPATISAVPAAQPQPGRSAAAAMFDDDDFSIPDIDLPGMTPGAATTTTNAANTATSTTSSKPSLPSAPPAHMAAAPMIPAPLPASSAPSLPSALPKTSATSAASKAIFDDDDFSVPDIDLGGKFSTGGAIGTTNTTAPTSSMSAGFDDFGDLDGPGSPAHNAATANATPNKATTSAAPPVDTNPFGSDDWGADPFASASIGGISSSSSSSSAAQPGASSDPFGSNPFGGDDFGMSLTTSTVSSIPSLSSQTPPSAKKATPPQPPSSAPSAPPPSLARGPSFPSPPPRPPSGQPPTPKPIATSTSNTTTTTPPKITSPTNAANTTTAANKTNVNKVSSALDDDDGWDVPDGVPGGDDVKPGDWSSGGAHDDWGF